MSNRNWIDKLPVWLIVLLVLYIAGAITYAIIDNRTVEFLPPKIYEKSLREAIEAGDEEAQTLQITEGNQEWSGDWQIGSFGKEFSCGLLHTSGQTLIAKCIAVQSDNFYAIRRLNSSDGNNCNYFGTRVGESISGVYFCSDGGPHEWSAKVL